MTCLLVGGLTLALAGPVFTLDWVHSVEKIAWRETWQIADGGLDLVEARVKGSGAGMEPGDSAVLRDGWWVWQPGIRVAALHLAASGATGAGWRLCDGTACHDLGGAPGMALRIAPCAP